MLGNNWVALGVTFFLALAWLRVNDYLAHKGWISGQLSRKIIHIGTGPIFVLCWILFDQAPSARFIAAFVPFAITIQFFLVGLGVLKDDAAVAAMSRTGRRQEILKGPFFYGVVFVIITLIFWTDSPVGIVALMLLCGGDGLADVIGKRVKSSSIPWSPKKTWAGTIAMFLGGWLFTILVLWFYIVTGVFQLSIGGLIVPVTIIALVGTIIESLPVSDFDNITVPAVAILLGLILF